MHIEYNNMIYCCRHQRLFKKGYLTGELYYPTVLIPNIAYLSDLKDIQIKLKNSLQRDYDESLLRLANSCSKLSISYTGAIHLLAELKENFAFLPNYSLFNILEGVLMHKKLIHDLERLCKYRQHLQIKVSASAKEIYIWLLKYFNLELDSLGFSSGKINILLEELDFIPLLIKNIQHRVKDTHALVWFDHDLYSLKKSINEYEPGSIDYDEYHEYSMIIFEYC